MTQNKDRMFRSESSSAPGGRSHCQHLGPHARAAGAERTTEIRGSMGEISATDVSLATAVWLQTMVPLSAADTVELQGYFQAADG
ncbi:MAG: hypothetical protein ABJI96_23115 [Paracoccaceae bacterium]